MMASRGMGAIRASKMPGKKTVRRKDDPDKVATYRDGGKTKDELKPYVQGQITSDKYGSGGGGRAGFTKSLGKDADIGAFLEGGGFKPKDGEFKGKVTGGGITFSKLLATTPSLACASGLWLRSRQRLPTVQAQANGAARKAQLGS
jgi:hypothetical protein